MKIIPRRDVIDMTFITKHYVTSCRFSNSKNIQQLISAKVQLVVIVQGAGGTVCIWVRGKGAAVCAATGRKGEVGVEGAPERARGASAKGATPPTGAQAHTAPRASKGEPFQLKQLPPGCCFPHLGDTLDTIEVVPSIAAAPSTSAPLDLCERNKKKTNY